MSGSYIKDGERIIDEDAETKPPVLEPVVQAEVTETTVETDVTGE